MQNAEGKTTRESRAEAPRDIGERTLAYAVRAVRLFRVLQEGDDRAGWIIGKQYLRSATSIGANLAEARSGESRKDFVHKIQIALKEARESLYWLQLLQEADVMSAERLLGLIGETDEIVSVLVAIIRSSHRNDRP